MKVFIADSSPLLCQKLASMLSELDGLEIVGQAQEARGALSAIRESSPDVVLLDVHLLGSNGLDLLKTIKREGRGTFVLGRGTFVMMLADDVSCLYQKKCLDAGADYLLHKSADLRKAMAILQGLLQHFHSMAVPEAFLEG